MKFSRTVCNQNCCLDQNIVFSMRSSKVKLRNFLGNSQSLKTNKVCNIIRFTQITITTVDEVCKIYALHEQIKRCEINTSSITVILVTATTLHAERSKKNSGKTNANGSLSIRLQVVADQNLMHHRIPSSHLQQRRSVEFSFLICIRPADAMCMRR